MTISGRKLIEKFMRKHANSKASLSGWVVEVTKADWQTPQDIKERYRSADFLSGNRVIFDVGGNNYRVLVLVRYKHGNLVIEKIGTHAEYSKWKL